MIRSFRHKGLRRFFENEDRRGIPTHLAPKLLNVLTFLNVAENIGEVAPLPGLRLHQLKGELQGYWSITISGNWRVIFRFERGDAHDVDFVDYH
jgi:proteic killer suppression protein